MGNFLSGVAAVMNTMVPAKGDQPRMMMLPGCFDDVDLAARSTDIRINHDGNLHLGSCGNNAYVWLDGDRLRFEVRLDSGFNATRVARDEMARGNFLGCSIDALICKSEMRSDAQGVPYRAILKVHSIADCSVVSVGANYRCGRPELTDESVFEAYQHDRIRRLRAALQNTTHSKPARSLPEARSGGKRPKKLISMPPMPRGMVAGYAIAAAAASGEGVEVFGRKLSAHTVQNLVSGGQFAIV